MAMHKNTTVGKRVREYPARVEVRPETFTHTPEQLGYIHNLRDPRFHIKIEMDGLQFNALIDTGATHSYVGRKIGEILRHKQTEIRDTPNRTVIVANGTNAGITGITIRPVQIASTVRWIELGIVPTLTWTCIIGIDAIRQFGMQLNFAQDTWTLDKEPNRTYIMERWPKTTPTPIEDYIVKLENTDQETQTHKETKEQETQTHTKQAKAAELQERLAKKAATQNQNTEVGKQTQTNTPHKRKALLPTPDIPPNPNLYPRYDKRAPRICSGIQQLTDPQHTQLQTLLTEKITALPGQLGLTHLTSHKIDTQGHAPIKQRYYMVSPKIKDAIYEEVDKMLSEDVIEPSNSEWSSPIVMIKKPNNTYRFCLDFRKVNSASRKDAYPLPYMTAILDKLRAAQYISKLDLSQAYFQIPLHTDSRHITAFTVPGKGLYQFKRMPYGLTGAPATFQRLLDKIIGPESEPYAFAYLDDIIIVTQTFEEHLHWLGTILEKIKSAGLTINPEKCEFGCAQVKYLGYLVDKHGLHVDTDKIQPLIDYPEPKTLKQLRRLVGMASWYRRFIPNFAHITEPLTRLLKKDQKWTWGTEQQNATNKIKQILTSPPTLTCPDHTLPFQVQTDASGTGLGAVLTQTKTGEEQVIAYASRALSEAERKYTTTERECLAVIWAIQKFRPYVEGYHFTVITDHSALKWLHNLKNPTGRLARWALELLEYDFDIIHRKGSAHQVPDALSRLHEDEEPIQLGATEHTDDKWYTYKKTQVQTRPEKNEAWRIRDTHLYFHRPDPLHSNLLPDTNPWKLVIPKE